jgi:tellurite resistance protein TerC
MGHTVLVWTLFNLFILALLALDLGVFHRKTHVVSLREALVWSVIWIVVAFLFNGLVYFWRGPQAATEFLAGYLIERSLSIDNLFVFVLIFSYFRVPDEYQHKILFWGILGALVMRALFIATGVALIHKFHWIIYVFGVFLIITGVRIAIEKGKEIHPERNPVLRMFKRIMPLVHLFHGDKFFVRLDGRLFATPMFVVLLMVETTDVIFAMDSIPAILAITYDPFIVYSSNVFAILGLRATYFALAGIMRLFRYIHFGIAAILVFVGVKMVVTDIYKIPVGIALGVIAVILALSIVVSLIQTARTKGKEPPVVEGRR